MSALYDDKNTRNNWCLFDEKFTYIKISRNLSVESQMFKTEIIYVICHQILQNYRIMSNTHVGRLSGETISLCLHINMVNH